MTTGCSSVILERCPGRSYAARVKIGLIVRTRPFLHFFTSFTVPGELELALAFLAAFFSILNLLRTGIYRGSIIVVA